MLFTSQHKIVVVLVVMGVVATVVVIPVFLYAVHWCAFCLWTWFICYVFRVCWFVIDFVIVNVWLFDFVDLLILLFIVLLFSLCLFFVLLCLVWFCYCVCCYFRKQMLSYNIPTLIRKRKRTWDIAVGNAPQPRSLCYLKKKLFFCFFLAFF